MQRDPLISALVGALFLVSAVILALGIGYHYQSRQSRRLQAQLLATQNTRMVAEALANEAIAYSRHNAAINPVLLRAGIRPAGQATTTK